MKDDEVDVTAVKATMAEAIAAIDAVEEAPPPPPKVVDMRGNPTDKQGNKTHPRIYEVIAQIQKEIEDEPCMGIAIAFLDAGGRVGTKFFYEAGYAHHTVSGTAILQSRVIANWEKSLLVSPGSGS